MVDVSDITDQIQNIISGNLNIPPEVLLWPSILFQLIIPGIASFIIYFSILHKGIKLIKSSLINFFLAIIFTIFSLPFIIYAPASILLTIAVFSYFFIGGTHSLKNLLFAIVLGAVVLIAYTYISSFAMDYFK